jgi:hypothetical protein
MPHHCNDRRDSQVLLCGKSLNAATHFEHAYLHQSFAHNALAATAAR